MNILPFDNKCFQHEGSVGLKFCDGNEINFVETENKTSTIELDFRNHTGHFVVFRLKRSHPDSFTIKPRSSVLLDIGESQTIFVDRTAKCTDIDEFDYHLHIEAAVFSDTTKSHTAVNAETVWKLVNKRRDEITVKHIQMIPHRRDSLRDIKESRFTVVFVDPHRMHDESDNRIINQVIRTYNEFFLTIRKIKKWPTLTIVFGAGFTFGFIVGRRLSRLS